VFEGDGRIEEYVGADVERWVRPAAAAPETPMPVPVSKDPAPPQVRQKKKLSYKEQREFETLPARIDAIETEERDLQQRVSSPDFYREGAAAIREALNRAEQLRSERDALYARWAELEARAG
jgi:ATP-binding cassette subfamily F protein uup